MPDKVKSFREIDSRQDRPRARPGFVKPIRNGLRNVQNLIKCRPFRAETCWRGKRMELDFRKKSRRDRMMRSKSFDTHEVREIGGKEAGESRAFPILCMSSRWKERNAKTKTDGKCEEENSCQSEEGALAWDRQLCLGQWQWTRRGWRQPHEIQRE